MTDDPKVIPIKGRKRQARLSAKEIEGKLDELVGMSLADYAPRRYETSEATGIPVGLLDSEYRKRQKQAGGTKATDDFPSAEPVTYPVDGDDLLQEIVDLANRHLVLPDGAAEIIATWALFTYVYDNFNCSPFLTITSPTPECGKTRVLTLLSKITNRPMPSNNISPSAIFRSIEKWKPTLLIDELETFVSGDDALRGILNCGHDREFSFVVRCDGENLEPKRFSTWCPKAVALIGKLHPTLASRSIHISLKRKLPRDYRPEVQGKNYSYIQSKAARWAEDHGQSLSLGKAVLPDGIHGRDADNWRPLIQVADAAGGDWRDRLLRIALKHCTADKADDHLVTLLHDVVGLFGEKGTDRLSSEEIVSALNDMEHRPWPEWKNGKPISKPQLARLLGRLDIVSAAVRLPSGENLKGYHLDRFDDALTHYPTPATPYQTVTPSPALQDKGLRVFQTVTEDEPVTLSNNEKSQKPNGCDAVTAKNPPRAVGGGDNDPFATLKDHDLALQPTGIEPSFDYPELPACLDRRRPRCTACDSIGERGCPTCKPENFDFRPAT